MVEGVPQPIRLPTDVGLDVGQDRLLAQVIPDDPRHVGVDRLVVGDPGADRVGERDVAGAIGPHQPGHAEQAVRPERFGIEKIVVDPAVDHVDRGEARSRLHEHPIVFDDQVVALDQRDTELAGEKDVLEIGRVEDARRQEDDLRVVDALGRDRAQRLVELGPIGVDLAKGETARSDPRRCAASDSGSRSRRRHRTACARCPRAPESGPRRRARCRCRRSGHRSGAAGRGRSSGGGS